tara:strand:- start:1397 stop:1714 length:318 start_codon:yes stop_codon:yes gene_type:complete
MPILRYNLKIKVMSNSRLEIKNLKLLPNTALFWGDDAEDVKISTGITQATFDKMFELVPDRPSFYAGDNDDEMFEILFSNDDTCAYDLIEDYYDEWGKYIEIETV